MQHGMTRSLARREAIETGLIRSEMKGRLNDYELVG